MVFTESQRPFRHWVMDDGIKPVSDDDIPSLDSPQWEARYDNELEQGKLTLRKPEGVLAERLKECVGSMMEWRIRFGAELCEDPTLHGGGIHLMKAGGWLQTHLDYAKHPKLNGKERRLNIIAFLHPEWKPEWGGHLLLADPMGKPVVEIEPKPGRVVAFETSDNSYHGVRQLSKDAKPRVTAAVYLITNLRDGVTRERALFMPNRNNGECPFEVQ